MERGKGLILIVLFVMINYGIAQNLEVELIRSDTDQRVDVRIGGKLFTSYQYGPEFDMKPVFYPVFSPGGLKVNREIPLKNEKLKEKMDHPHHQSVFMGYGDVDGQDFWSHQKEEKVVHRAILETVSGADNRFSFLADWISGSGEALVREIRTVEFGGTEDCLWMDHQFNLTALGQARAFSDTKEGLFAIRVAESLREDKGSGHYLNAYGWKTADQIWGKRAPWVALQGKVDGQPVTVAIFDHPSTENHPSYWHARAYGLFSVNPFGRKDFVKDSTPLNKVLQVNENYQFRYRLLVYQGTIDKSRLDQDYWDYIK